MVLWPRCQDIAEALLHQSCIASEVVRTFGNMDEADCWLASQFNCCGRVISHCLLWGVSPADNGRRNSHCRVQKYLYCVSGCCGTRVITGARKMGSASVANWQNLGVDSPLTFILLRTEVFFAKWSKLCLEWPWGSGAFQCLLSALNESRLYLSKLRLWCLC